MAQKLILRNHQALGDAVSVTALPRDIHKAYPGRFEIEMQTSCMEVWDHNPHVVRSRGGPALELDLHTPQVNRSNQEPVHLVSAWHAYLGDQLGLHVPCTWFGGDLHLSAEEMANDEIGEPYWLVIVGGKSDTPTKIWSYERYQQVVDACPHVRWVQVGMTGQHGHSKHFNPPLRGVTDMRDKTSIRDLIRLAYHSRGALCGITGLMHIMAALPGKPGHPRQHPCVVVAGGREPQNWAGYPSHRWLGVTGSLPCCDQGGCWHIDVEPAPGRTSLCVLPVKEASGQVIPRCMQMIDAERVAEEVKRLGEWYFPRPAVLP